MGAKSEPAAASAGPQKARKGQAMGVKDPKPIMETNSSSIVSKRSVESAYYPAPHFLRYFVKKKKARAPLINRGYWLRMKCIENTVKMHCRSATRPVIVINLGAGFDALPFRLLATEPDLFHSTLFVDVDHEELVQSKISTILAEPELNKLLGHVSDDVDAKNALLESEKYWAVGCDLHDLARFKQQITALLEVRQESDILMVSEVATCYMEPDYVDRLFAWISGLDNVTLCLLEQHLPRGPHHPFAKTMLQHFKNVNGPLRAIHRYSTMAQQKARFERLGWQNTRVRSLWSIWSTEEDEDIVTKPDRAHLDRTELFDEWEELALFTSHYFLLTSHSSTHVHVDQQLRPSYNGSPAVSPSILHSASVSQDMHQSKPLPSRRFGCIFRTEADGVGIHGGYGASRLNTTLCLKSVATENALPPADIAPRMCHTITPLDKHGNLLLVGGRGSPDRVYTDCWLRWNKAWVRTAPLPIPVYRHCATRVSLSIKHNGVLIYGGRRKDGSSSDAWFLWDLPQDLQAEAQLASTAGQAGRWHRVESKGTLQGRFAASLATIDNGTSGLLIGGLATTGIFASPSRVIWRLARGNDGWTIEFDNISLSAEIDGNTETSETSLTRFGMSMTACGSGFLVSGGIGKGGVVPAQDEIIHLQYIHGRDKDSASIRMTRLVEYNLPQLLIGHSAVWDGEKVLVVGGGAVCFSFGTYYNRDGFYVYEDGTTSHAKFDTVTEVLGPSFDQAAKTLELPNVNVATVHLNGNAQHLLPLNGNAGKMQNVPSIDNISASGFQDVVKHAHPLILIGLDFGPCIQNWTPEYLVEKVGAERIVSIHSAETSHMAFQPDKRNFKYADVAFGDFMKAIQSGSKQYFRALSSANTNSPADLETDFPSIASDVQIPESLTSISSRKHSSVLRISGPVSLWLHYDVLANILVQIHGSKTLILFPPSDIAYLDVPAGFSTSRLSVEGLLSEQSTVLSHTHPRKVHLGPGDALFIPPLWLHCAVPNDGVSIAVNVFFRDLDQGYAVGRDTYGNRDVRAYEEGRKSLAKLVRGFDGLPPQMARFYLTRLAAELGKEAGRMGSR